MTNPANESTPQRRKLGCVLALLFCVGACDEDDKREPLPNWRAGYPDASTDSGVPELPDSFALVLPDTLQYSARLGQRDALDKPCAIARNEAPAKRDCIADMNELDLWALGFAYDIHVPQGMCDFILHVPYMFANFAVGQGPARVSFTVNKNGTFSDQVNAMNGKPYCEFDHKALNERAPNCCLGQYILEVTNAETGIVTTSMHSWGGKVGDCLYGAAHVEADVALDPEGVPMSRYIYMHRSEHTEHIEFDGVSDKFPANIAHANFFDPADHGGEMPAALSATLANPYYDAYCLDDASEIIAHLRLSVREWNQEVEFDKKGNPDTEGIEPAFSEGPIDLDDLADWKVISGEEDEFPNIPVVK